MLHVMLLNDLLDTSVVRDASFGYCKFFDGIRY